MSSPRKTSRIPCCPSATLPPTCSPRTTTIPSPSCPTAPVRITRGSGSTPRPGSRAGASGRWRPTFAGAAKRSSTACSSLARPANSCRPSDIPCRGRRSFACSGFPGRTIPNFRNGPPIGMPECNLWWIQPCSSDPGVPGCQGARIVAMGKSRTVEFAWSIGLRRSWPDCQDRRYRTMGRPPTREASGHR